MSVTGTRLPTSLDSYSGIEFFPVAIKLNVLPGNVSAESLEGKLEVNFSFAGTYTYQLFAHCHRRDGQLEVAYYVAYNKRNSRAEYAVGASRVEDFDRDGKTFASAAGLFYGIGREPQPAAVEVVVAQRHAIAGRPWQAMKANMRSVAKMWKDPATVMMAAADVGAIGAVKHTKPLAKPTIRPIPTPALPAIPPKLARSPVASPVYQISGRDIVIVDTSVGRQVFYRSSGANSAQPGVWFPIDEVTPATGWFNKEAYTTGPGLGEGSPLHRLGNPEFAKISEQLGNMKIPQGNQIPPGAFENAQVTLNRIMDFFNVRVTKTTRFRPVSEFTPPKSTQ